MKTNTVGCSSNAEFFGVFTDNETIEKLVLNDYGLTPSGTSMCVAKAMVTVGSNVNAFGLVGPSTSLANELLEIAARRSGIKLHTLNVLDKTSFAILPMDLSKDRNKVIGEKGSVISEKIGPAIVELQKGILRELDGFGVMTGLREEELPFAEVVFRHARKGMRVLSPRREFCHRLESTGILADTDCLVVNEVEYAATGTSIKDLHAAGPRVVIVTRGREGGEALINDHEPVTYHSVVETERESPGTGDWFLGALLAFMDLNSLTFESITFEELSEALRFAATISGRKATIPGAANGPSNAFCISKLSANS